jgi:transposase-like protein
MKSTGYVFVYLYPTYHKGRLGKAKQFFSRAAAVAMGVNVDGRRDLLGNSCGGGFVYKGADCQSEVFWVEVIASFRVTGFSDIKLVVNDALLDLS